MGNIVAWCSVALTLLMTVYAQVVFKMRLTVMGPMPQSLRGIGGYLLKLSLDPWIVTGLISIAVAAGAWLMALSRLPLGVIYPFMSLTVVAVWLASVLLLKEPLDIINVIAIALICAGLLLIAYRLH